MFSAPISLHAETAFELPSSLYESGEGNAWVEANLQGRYAHSFLRGLCFDADGRLWVADTPFGRIFRVSAGGEWQLAARYDGWPTALRFHPDGRLIVADARHGLLALDLATSQLAPFLTHHVSQRFKGIGGIYFSGNGDLYFSDGGQTGLQDASGAVYCLNAAGKLQCLLNNIPGPAGIALAADGSGVLVAAGGDNSVWHLPFAEAGVSRAARHIQLSGGSGPRGLAVDQEGNLLIAHEGLGCAWIFNKRGEPKYRIDSSRGDRVVDLALHPQRPNEVYVLEAHTGVILKASIPMY